MSGQAVAHSGSRQPQRPAQGRAIKLPFGHDPAAGNDHWDAEVVPGEQLRVGVHVPQPGFDAHPSDQSQGCVAQMAAPARDQLHLHGTMLRVSGHPEPHPRPHQRPVEPAQALDRGHPITDVGVGRATTPDPP